MLDGYGSHINILDHLVRDFNGRSKMGGYTLLQALEKLINRGESLICRGDPSYIWWSIIHSGEPEIDADLGKIKWWSNYPMVVQECQESGNWILLGDGHNEYEMPLDYFMLTRGISFGQRILTRWYGEYYRTSYEYNEYDIASESTIIFADYVPSIDIPVILENPIKKSKFVKLEML